MSVFAPRKCVYVRGAVRPIYEPVRSRWRGDLVHYCSVAEDFAPLDLLYLYREEVRSILNRHRIAHPRVCGERGGVAGVPLEQLSNIETGAEVLHLSNPGDYPVEDDNSDFEVIEVKD